MTSPFDPLSPFRSTISQSEADVPALRFYATKIGRARTCARAACRRKKACAGEVRLNRFGGPMPACLAALYDETMQELYFAHGVVEQVQELLRSYLALARARTPHEEAYRLVQGADAPL